MPRLDSSSRDSAMFHVTHESFSSHAIEFPVEVPHNRIVRPTLACLTVHRTCIESAGSRGALFTNHVSVTQPALGSRRQSILGKWRGRRVSLHAQSITLSAGGYLRVCDFRRTRGARSGFWSASPTVTCLPHLGPRAIGIEAISRAIGIVHWGAVLASSDWVVGLTPHLRYNFATGTRWIPFVDGGAGVTATASALPI